MIPSTRFDPVAVKLMNKYMPLANTGDGRWVNLTPSPNDDNQYLIRADYILSPKNSMDFRFSATTAV